MSEICSKKTWGSRPHLKKLHNRKTVRHMDGLGYNWLEGGSLLLNSLPLAKLKNNNGPSFANVQLSLKWSFLPTRTCARTHTLATTLSCSHTHTHTHSVIGVCLFPSSTMVSRVASMAYNFLWPQALFFHGSRVHRGGGGSALLGSLLVNSALCGVGKRESACVRVTEKESVCDKECGC